MDSFKIILSLVILSLISISVLSCSSDRLLLYQVSMNTYWSKENFPKDYPKFRPPAQWSKVVGRTHNASFNLYQIGNFASPGLKKFAETGNSDLIDRFSQGKTGVCDAFSAPPIPEGVGNTESQFFVDGNHSMVSLVSKIVPSPDWFVGVDSVDLCLRSTGEWVQSLQMDVDALDAGCDNGYTFTAPKWQSLPQEAIYQIKSSFPSHPASSFFYPDKQKHIPIATFTFTKLKEYSLWPQNLPSSISPPLDDPGLNDLNELNESQEIEQPQSSATPGVKRKRSRKLKNRNGSCIVSDWNDWSDCVSKTCDMSEQYRTRSILSHPRPGLPPCPPLTEKRVCVPDKGCQPNLFDW